MTNSIEVINLSKSYKSKQAVNNINFKINENEIADKLDVSKDEVVSNNIKKN